MSRKQNTSCYVTRKQQVAAFCDAEKDQNTYVANSDIEDVLI